MLSPIIISRLSLSDSLSHFFFCIQRGIYANRNNFSLGSGGGMGTPNSSHSTPIISSIPRRTISQTIPRRAGPGEDMMRSLNQSHLRSRDTRERERSESREGERREIREGERSETRGGERSETRGGERRETREGERRGERREMREMRDGERREMREGERREMRAELNLEQGGRNLLRAPAENIPSSSAPRSVGTGMRRSAWRSQEHNQFAAMMRLRQIAHRENPNNRSSFTHFAGHVGLTTRTSSQIYTHIRSLTRAHPRAHWSTWTPSDMNATSQSAVNRILQQYYSDLQNQRDTLQELSEEQDLEVRNVDTPRPVRPPALQQQRGQVRPREYGVFEQLEDEREALERRQWQRRRRDALARELRELDDDDIYGESPLRRQVTQQRTSTNQVRQNCHVNLMSSHNI